MQRNLEDKTLDWGAANDLATEMVSEAVWSTSKSMASGACASER